MDEIFEKLTTKKEELDRYRPLPPTLVENLEAWLDVELTYTSNAIEGNTLSRMETALVIEKGITVEGRSLREHLELFQQGPAADFRIGLFSDKRNSSLSVKNLLSHFQWSN